MNPELSNLLKDRRFQIAAGGVVAVGGFVFYTRRKASTNPAAATTIPVGSSGYVQGGADTTGTDIASYLGQYGATQNQALQDWAQQWSGNLQDTLDAIKNGQSGGQTTPTPVPTPHPTTLPAITPAPPGTHAVMPQYVTVAKFTTSNPPWNSTLSGIASHFKTSVGKLMTLNPSITNASLIHPNQQIRVS